MDIKILTFETIDSTNTEALKQARNGAEEGLCIVAREQTAGRGRHGRVWASEKDAGLYFSIVLRPRLEPRYVSLITLMSGIGVFDTLKELGLSPDIKWVNDVLVDERKISGILAETTETDDGQAVIVGIGINILRSNISQELAETATPLDRYIDPPTPTALVEMLVSHLSRAYSQLNGPDGPSQIVEEWKRRSTYFTGRNVRVKLSGETMIGTTDGLEPNGALRLITPDGKLRIVQAGEIEMLRPDPQPPAQATNGPKHRPPD